ncbi:MAG: hypothetical protein HY650_11215 [Acidobacteria bacterium]|nr:hypothetical protein [Acidobacteriota bacterium]
MMKQGTWLVTGTCAIALVVNGLGGMALGSPQEKDSAKERREVIVEVDGGGLSPHVMMRGMPVPRPGGGPGQGDVMTFVSSEMSFDSKVVKNAPYSAEAVTEHVQSLADGNRIVRKTTSSVYRDGEGRTRREQVMAGPWGPAGNSSQTVFINDPVAGVNYVLDPQARTARKLTLFRPDEPAEGKRVERHHRMMMESVEASGRRGRDMMVTAHAFNLKLSEPKTESLGKQVIEGVEAEGTRTTVTIPAGEIGNERAIEIVSEQWYSPSLQTVVQSRHSDPRVGENSFKLTSINRTEPARSLFDVPADYTIKDAGPEPIMRWKKEKPSEED